ncbi:sugar kinase [Natronosporangium hydrolyticum]|uniref:Sugar kinase n=2 Tax=Natronosporangium hydrolyticum TaxID=2811111 RepID=A0A895YGY5_9ACTN|nr:sugar kinase [Natronosporangium hydrolyticum]
MSWDVLCVGESMGLVTPDPPAPLRHGPPLRLEVAGAESNVASWLAQLGAKVGWRSRLGADPFGELIRARLAAAGVDTSEVVVDQQAPTGIYFKDPAADGATTVYYYRRGSAAAAMDRRLLADAPAARVVHLSGITAALSGSCADLLHHALAERPAPGALMSFDINYRPALWPVAQAGPALAKLAAAADLVFVGRDEAQVLWGTATVDEVRARLPEPTTLVVKDGPVGATAYHGDDRFTVPAPPVTVVEPVGAGDAFAAGYLWGVLNDAAPAARLRLGHLLAGCALRTAGDIGELPTAAELAAAMQEGR